MPIHIDNAIETIGLELLAHAASLERCAQALTLHYGGDDRTDPWSCRLVEKLHTLSGVRDALETLLSAVDREDKIRVL